MRSFKCLRAELKMIQPPGAIVNMASTAGFSGESRSAPYSVSKHAVSTRVSLI